MQHSLRRVHIFIIICYGRLKICNRYPSFHLGDKTRYQAICATIINTYCNHSNLTLILRNNYIHTWLVLGYIHAMFDSRYSTM